MRPIKNAIVRRMGALASVTVMNLSLSALPCQAADLFKDDFSNFPPGWLSSPVGSLNAAIQEYHYLPHRGVPLGPWANAICHLDAWLIGDEEGHPYLEQHSVNSLFFKLMNPTFLTGDAEWSDYTVEAKVKPLSLDGRDRLSISYQSTLLPFFAYGREESATGPATAAGENFPRGRVA
jgi:hypothetical protein